MGWIRNSISTWYGCLIIQRSTHITFKHLTSLVILIRWVYFWKSSTSVGVFSFQNRSIADSIRSLFLAQFEITVVESTVFMQFLCATVSPGVSVIRSAAIAFEQFLQNQLIGKPDSNRSLSNFYFASSLFPNINVKITGLDIHFQHHLSISLSAYIHYIVDA